MTTKAWKVYGRNGHRQRESFAPSISFTAWSGEKVEVLNADKTGTNEYSVVIITAESDSAAELALDGQITDGVFENSRVGDIVEIDHI